MGYPYLQLIKQSTGATVAAATTAVAGATDAAANAGATVVAAAT